MRITPADKYEYLFNNPYETTGAQMAIPPALRSPIRYRTKTITSGQVREIEIFPLWDTRSRDADRARRGSGESRDAQKALNRKNAAKRFRRSANANFTKDDLHITLTYDPKRHPLPDEVGALRDIRNYIRRCRRIAGSALKYLYVIEWSDGDGRRVQVHHHVIMSGIDRAAAMAAWGKGRVTADELQPTDGGIDGLATYMTKQPGKKNSKRWGGSQNLKKPVVTISDTKISRRKAAELAGDVEAYAPHIFARHNPEYIFDGCEVKISDFVSGVYIYAQMHKEPLPKNKKRRRE